jgi:hypothetical protein
VNLASRIFDRVTNRAHQGVDRAVRAINEYFEPTFTVRAGDYWLSFIKFHRGKVARLSVFDGAEVESPLDIAAIGNESGCAAFSKIGPSRNMKGSRP